MRTSAETILSQIASEAYTERYILHGTADEYVLREELVDQACSIAEAALSTAIGQSVFNGAELEAFARFVTLVRRLDETLPLSDDSVSNEEILRSREWSELRMGAQELLRALGVDSSQWDQYAADS